jgi:hypothetical protein
MLLLVEWVESTAVFSPLRLVSPDVTQRCSNQLKNHVVRPTVRWTAQEASRVTVGAAVQQ